MPDAAPDTTTDDLTPLYKQLLQQTLQPAPVAYPQTMQPTSSSSDGRSTVSLLGEALGGGSSYGTPAEREAAGTRALLSLGVGMLGASGYSPVRRTLGEVVASGIGGAQQSLAQSGSVAAAQAAALQEYQQKQQEMQLARIKEAIPILTALQGQQRLTAASNIALGKTPGTTPGASLAEVTRDPNAPTAGQQAFNPGNIMSTSAPGQSGVMTLPGDRKLAVFPDIKTGVAATADQLATYAQTHGITTVADAVTRWVSDPKADLKTYIADVARAIGVGPNDKIDLTDPKVQRAFILAQQPHESGKLWLKPEDVDAGIALSQARRKGGTTVATTPPPPAAPGSSTAPPTIIQGKPGEAPPPPPGGPPGAATTYAGGGIGTALAPQPTTLPVPPIPPTEVVGKGNAIPAGKIPGKTTADIIQQGMQLAQTTPLPGVQTAGLGTAGWGTGGATSYGDTAPGTVTPSAVPTPPASSQAPPAVPSVVTPPATLPVPPVQTTLQPGEPAPFTYQRQPLPPDIQHRIDAPLTAEQLAPYDQAIRTAVAGGDIKEMTKAQQDRAAAIATAAEKAREAAETWQQNERNKQQDIWQKRWDAWNTNTQQAQQTQQKLENDLRIKQAEGEQQRLTNKEAVFNQANQKGLETAQTEQANARDIVTQAEGFRVLSDNVGQPGWLQTTKFPGTDQTIAEKLQQAGWKLDDTSGVQMLRGGINNLIKTLRQGMPMGSLSDRDLNFIERMGPTEWMDQDTRTAAVSYMVQAYRAKMRFASDVQKEMARGKNYGDALDAADAKAKPFVPAVPADLTASWNSKDPAAVQRRAQWAEENDVRPGTLFHLSDGRIMVMRDPNRPPKTEQR